MTEDHTLERTNRINMLFDFYRRLLTDKQQMFMQYYYHEDYSLGEISEVFHISRQAVYEHIKRAQRTLEQYEEKLGLLAGHEQRAKHLAEIEKLADGLPQPSQHRMKSWIQAVRDLDKS